MSLHARMDRWHTLIMHTSTCVVGHNTTLQILQIHTVNDTPNKSLIGTQNIPKASRPHEHVQGNATAVVAQFAQGRRSRQDLQKMRGVDVAE